MEMLKADLEAVLDLEREGERRLEHAESEARSLIEEYRRKAEKIGLDTERSIGRAREERLARVEKEISERIERLEERFGIRMEEASRKAQENRRKAVDRVLKWLGGEDG